MRSFIVFLLLFISFGPIAQAEKTKPSICSEAVLAEDTPVLAGGRVKPFFVLAKETVKFVTGKSKFNGESPSLTFCRIMLQTQTESEFKFPIIIEHVYSKKILGLKDSDKTMDGNALIEQKELVRAEVLKIKDNNSEKKALTKLFNRIDTYQKVKEGKGLKLYTKLEGKEKGEWVPYSDLLLDKAIASNIEDVIKESKGLYLKEHNDTFMLELTYVKSHIFSYALLTSLIGIFLTVLFKKLNGGIALAIITLVIETIGMTMRVMISGRAPITNMYETVMFSGYGALIIALIIMFWKRDKIYLLAGLGYNILCLFMMMFANNMLSSSISPLVPVLRDNFWLSTHVTTIILSYAALALSWLVANITLIKLKLKKLTKSEYRYYQSLIYTCIKIGIVLLSAGIILGGVWADYSWGRFWGWDPKETWSLIVLLFYMVIVHGRFSNWINTHRFVILSAAGYMTVMMAWFGVNYILASGLHSYGFSEGGAIFLFSFFAVQIIILVICGFRNDFKEMESAETK